MKIIHVAYTRSLFSDNEDDAIIVTESKNQALAFCETICQTMNQGYIEVDIWENGSLDDGHGFYVATGEVQLIEKYLDKHL